MKRLNDVELEMEKGVRSPLAATWSVEGENDWRERFTTNNYDAWKLIAFKWSITILQNGCIIVLQMKCSGWRKEVVEEKDNWIRHLVARRRREEYGESETGLLQFANY